MADFDKQKFVDYLNANLSDKRFGEGACAKHVRLGLAAGGASPITWPLAAKDWGGTLLALGFVQVAAVAYVETLGDVAVIQPPKSAKKQYGHIEGFDGTHWVSDFVQTGFWPGADYRSDMPSYVVYRRPD